MRARLRFEYVSNGKHATESFQDEIAKLGDAREGLPGSAAPTSMCERIKTNFRNGRIRARGGVTEKSVELRTIDGNGLFNFPPARFPLSSSPFLYSPLRFSSPFHFLSIFFVCVSKVILLSFSFQSTTNYENMYRPPLYVPFARLTA